METKQPDNTAVRTALWRALHVFEDKKPHVIEDTVGYELIAPEHGWQERPDMKYTKRLRASVVARARYIEDKAKQQLSKGIEQYVLLGAGLDSFAQRNAESCSMVDIYEIDQPDTLAWKQEKLKESRYGIARNLHFVPVDFEATSWWDALLHKGFNPNEKAFVSCTGVTLYLTKEAIKDLLQRMTALASGSSVAIAFYLPIQELDTEDQPMQEIANKGAESSGTPFVSFLSVNEVEELATEAGLDNISIVSTAEMNVLYFGNRSDGLVPASGEFFLCATVA